jgi:hypothetical protein
MNLNQFLAKYCPHAPEPWHIPDVPLELGEEPAGVLHRGSLRYIRVFADPCCDGLKLGQGLPEGFADIQEFTLSPHRIVWKNDALRTIVTCCEGDVTVTVDRTDEWYEARLRSAHHFYALYR